MGSPASPASCDMVVAVCEQSWTHTYRTITYNVKHTTPHQFTISGHFATRYVDNRLTLIPSATQHSTHFRQFLSPDFYGPPIYLETEPGLDFLGFTIDPDTTAYITKPPTTSQTLLSPHSASPTTVLKSSLKARAILAKRLATPTPAVTQAMEQLTEVYTRAGYDPQWIRRCITKEKLTFVTVFHSVVVLFHQCIKHSSASRSHLSTACIAVQKVARFSRFIWPCARASHSHTDLTDDQRQGAFRSRSPRSTIEAAQPSRPSDTSTLRTQLFRVAASEDADGTHATPDPSAVDTEVEYEEEKDAPPPMTPPPMSSKQLGQFDPTAAVPEEILQRIDSLQRALKDSQCQIEGLLQQTTTLLATQHETTAALLSTCKQQLDVLESLLRRNSTDWS
eukprot:s456_g4.t1